MGAGKEPKSGMGAEGAGIDTEAGAAADIPESRLTGVPHTPQKFPTGTGELQAEQMATPWLLLLCGAATGADTAPTKGWVFASPMVEEGTVAGLIPRA